MLTDGFAWFTAAGVVASVIGASGSLLPRAIVVVLIVLVLASWVLRPAVDSWWIVTAEAAAITIGCLVMPSPEPAIGLLFGVITRRAIRDRLGPRLARAAPAFFGYLFGTVTVLLGRQAAAIDPAVLAPSLMPLVGLVIGTLALNDTVAAVRTAEAAQRVTVAANERLSAILRTSPITLVLLSAQGAVTMWNDRAHEMFGWTDKAVRSVPCPHHRCVAACANGCLTSLLHNKSVEWRYPNADGTARTVVVHITEVPELEGTHGTLLAIMDISARKNLEDQLRARVERDQLTGVASRARFTDLLHAALDSERRPALVLIDLDDFKAINDAHGHPIGDEFLVAAARRIEHAVDQAGAVCRLGGDEFAVLLPDFDEQQTRRLGERILAALASTGPVVVRKVPIRASIGVAAADPGESADTLLRYADTA
ncbi:MAG: sensor domain-containing diguanylate cyclase, partial [Kibdelosporangium sp.]